MKLAVLLGELDVARLERRGDGHISFHFLDAYRALRPRPTLSVYYLDKLREPGPPAFHLPAFFANLLPESGGPLRQLVAAAAGVPPDDELRLLAHLGEDLPGAVRVRVLDEGDPEATYHPPPLAPSDAERGARLRFSLAGVQLKFSVVREGKSLVLPASGSGGDWIVKLPDRQYPRVPEHEYATMSWARASGVEIPDFELVSSGEIVGLADRRVFPPGELAFAIRRFDRPRPGTLLQIEDFAQVNGLYPAHKYDQYRPVAKRLSYDTLAKQILVFCGEEDLRRFVRRLVFVALSGNADAHLKNWSLWYPDGRAPRLSPAYDQVCTIAYDDTDEKLALPLGGSLDMTAVSVEALRRLGERLRVGPDLLVEWGREAGAEILDAYAATSRGLPFSDEARVRLAAHHQHMRRAPGSLLAP